MHFSPAQGAQENTFCQAPGLGLRLGVDYVLPLSQEEQEQEPPPKTTRKILTICLEFCTWTWRIPLMEDKL